MTSDVTEIPSLRFLHRWNPHDQRGSDHLAHPVPVELLDLRPVLDPQSGIVAGRQIYERGGTRGDLRRWLRSRELVEVHKGVYVNHTGPLSWTSRAWAGVQRYWPAVLAHESAIRLAGDLIHVGISAHRSAPAVEPRVQVHRLADFEARVHLDRSPPCQRYEDAALSACVGLARPQALELISEACRSRRTTPLRLHSELLGRRTLADRAWLLGVLDDAAEGVQSVLESSYLRRVERAHGLPRGERQLGERTAKGRVYRDVRYRAWHLLVELDGRLGHEEWSDRVSDMTRDLLAAARSADFTLRLGWHHCEVEPCLTAIAVGAVLQQRGWTGSPQPCSPVCPAGSGTDTLNAG